MLIFLFLCDFSTLSNSGSHKDLSIGIISKCFKNIQTYLISRHLETTEENTVHGLPVVEVLLTVHDQS
jgi:hypothetical protein